MAVLDPGSDAVVIRIVYDGPPEAGKTTSLRTLAARLGARCTSPREINGHTLYFDWVEYTGGLFEGHRIRCQIVSVPGQASLASRRAALLLSADAVVFVGDTRQGACSAMRSYLDGMRAVLDSIEGPPVGVVMQANKRDHASAMPLAELRQRLCANESRLALVESVATDGTGIREAFVFAVRLALDRVRELIASGTLRAHRPTVDSEAELLAQIKEREGTHLDLAVEDGLSHTTLAEIQGETRVPSALVPPPTLAASVTDVPIPPCEAVPSGLVWPPIDGRLMLNEAQSAGTALHRTSVDAWTGISVAGWYMNSSRDSQFMDLEHGREALLEWARTHAGCAAWLSPARCLVLMPNAGHYRLWQLVRPAQTLAEELQAAPRHRRRTVLRDMIRAYRSAARSVLPGGLTLPLSLTTLTRNGGGLRFTGLAPYPWRAAGTDAPPTGVSRELRMQLRSVFAS